MELNRDIRAELTSDYISFLSDVPTLLYSQGWGASGNDKAILLLDEQGVWTSFLYVSESVESLLLETSGASDGQADFTKYGEFQEVFLEALTINRDYSLLQSLMRDPFIIGLWQSEGIELTPPAAAERLRTDLLPPAAVIFYSLGTDLTAILGGLNPLQMWNPAVNIQRGIFSEGWGPDGNGEVMLMIALGDDGQYYWYSMLYAPFGF